MFLLKFIFLVIFAGVAASMTLINMMHTLRNESDNEEEDMSHVILQAPLKRGSIIKRVSVPVLKLK